MTTSQDSITCRADITIPRSADSSMRMAIQALGRAFLATICSRIVTTTPHRTRMIPAIYLDRDGRSLDQVDFDSREDLDEQDIGPTGAGSQWSMFTSTMRSAVKGLNMAMGMKNTSSTEKHHAASNKNKTYTPQFKEIFDRYNMSLNAEENIIPLEGHSGRHTNAYHNFILMSLSELDAIARGNSQLFYEGFMLIVDFVRDNPWLPYAK